jgi:hypothetical protein
MAMLAVPAPDAAETGANPAPEQAAVRCASVLCGAGVNTSCISDRFLAQARRDTNIATHTALEPVALGSDRLFEFPFAVLTGDGEFTLDEVQCRNLRDYLVRGGFLVASAACGSPPWNASFRRQLKRVFPDLAMTRLAADHPIFRTVYELGDAESDGRGLPLLEGLTIDERLVVVWCPDGLNDTDQAGPECCCCGGTEVKAAARLKVNILAYALTH